MAGFSPQEALGEVEKWDSRLGDINTRLTNVLGKSVECPREQKSDEENLKALLALCNNGVKDDEEAQCMWKGLTIGVNNLEGKLRDDPVDAQKKLQDVWPMLRQGIETVCLPALERYLDKREGKPAMTTAAEVAKKEEAAAGVNESELLPPTRMSMKWMLIIGAVLVVLVLVVWWFRDSLGSSQSASTSVSQSSTVTKQNFGNPPTAYTRS